MSAAWLLARRPFSWFDVLHMHHIEYDDISQLEQLLHACHTENIRIVFTAHDTVSMFSSEQQLMERFRLLAEVNATWVFLTQGSAESVQARLPQIREYTVIPHGFVVPPGCLVDRQRNQSATASRYLLYGAVRPNRDHLSAVINWRLGLRNKAARLRLLLRAFSPADFADGKQYIIDLIATATADPRIETSMRPYPTDMEVADAALDSDALLLPYLWGTHSGQLELAFDLNLLPICSRVGFLQDQVTAHDGRVTTPMWFDWSSGHPYLFGERFLTALEEAEDRLRERGVQPLDPAFLDYRREEHRQILTAYTAVYGSSPGIR